MTLRSTWLLLALLMLAPMPALAEAAPTPPRSVDSPMPDEGGPAAFDRLFRELDLGGLGEATPDQAREEVARLHGLLPTGDARRELEYRYLACRLPADDPMAGVEAASQGLEDARRLDEKPAQARFLYCRARSREALGRPDQSLTDWEAGLALAREAGEWRLVADGLIGRGHMRSLLGEHARALNDFITAQELYTSTGNARLARDNVINLGTAYRRMGEYDKALAHLQQGHDQAAGRGDSNAQALALLQQGYLFEELDQPAKAQDAYERLIELLGDQGSPSEIGFGRVALGSALIRQQQYRPALDALAKAEADFASIQDTSSLDRLHLHRGQALAGLGRHREALVEFNAAARHMAAANNERYLALLLPERSRTLEALGETEQALDDYKHFIEIQERLLASMSEQRSVAMRHQYDATRRELDTRRLTTETALRRQELDALMKARRWQWIALSLGVVLVLVLATLVWRQKRRARRLGVMAMTDELTRIANRRNIELFGEEAVAAALDERRPLTVLALDIDFFKKFNDTFGHHAGDRVLTRVAAAAQGALRQIDRLGRIGGEEFLAVLPGTGAEAGAQVAERVRSCVEDLDLDDIADGIRVTISIGVAELHPADADFKALVARADRALYRAKANGRNRVEPDLPASGT